MSVAAPAPSLALAPAHSQAVRWPPRGLGLHRSGGTVAGLKSLEASAGRPVIDLVILVAAREHKMQYDSTINGLVSVRDGL
jgi:hypothetical protein